MNKKKVLITGGIFIPATTIITGGGIIIKEYVNINNKLTKQEVKVEHMEKIIERLDNRQYNHTRKHLTELYTPKVVI